MQIAILGAGAWGTGLAISLSIEHQVSLWVRDTNQRDEMALSRVNKRYFPGFHIPHNICLEIELDQILGGGELVIVATPIAALREILDAIRKSGKAVPVIWLCKGLEPGTAKLPHQVADEILSGLVPTGVLSGPSFAQEVARGLPTALTCASVDLTFSREIAASLHSPRMRIYSTEDVIGVEIGGAVKNVMAIAAGICDGMSYGGNARAALITRGLAEITRLGLRLGGRMETFLGLAGVGDLILTCTGDLSRNRRVGMLLASADRPLQDILHELGHVAEGVYTAKEVLQLGTDLGIEMPITRAVCQVLYNRVSPKIAVEELLSREPKVEYE